MSAANMCFSLFITTNRKIKIKCHFYVTSWVRYLRHFGMMLGSLHADKWSGILHSVTIKGTIMIWLHFWRALILQSSTDNKNIVSSAYCNHCNTDVGHKLLLCLLFHSHNQTRLTILSFLLRIWRQTAALSCCRLRSVLTYFMLKPISLHTQPLSKQQKGGFCSNVLGILWGCRSRSLLSPHPLTPRSFQSQH